MLMPDDRPDLGATDPVTGLPTRQMLAALATQTAMTSALIGVLDIDRFREINLHAGHAGGDQVLAAIAARLREHLGDSGIILRLGDDEFAFVASASHWPRIADCLMRLLSRLAEPVQTLEGPLQVTVSVGVARYPQDDPQIGRVFAHAEMALGLAKAHGGNGFSLYTPGMQRRASRSHALLARLRLAVEREEFLLHYQPQVDMRSGNLIGWESLLRWQPAEGKMRFPGEFIGLLEESGLIIPVGEWVTEQAARQGVRWRSAGLSDRRIAVNLSARQLRLPHIGEQMIRIVSATGWPMDGMEFEVTESMLQQDITRTTSALQQLRDRGASVAMDDFGTGFAALDLLRRMPCDRIKIDRVFLQEQLPRDAAILQSVRRLGEDLGMCVLVEGIETAAQESFLLELGFRNAQGYFYARPMAPDDCLRWASSRSYIAPPPS